MKAWWVRIHSGNRLSGLRDTFSLAILAMILLTAFALRLYRLNDGLWLDEVLTYVNYAKMPLRQIISTYDYENQNLLYSVLAHASFRVFGESAWSLRLPAVLFGVASIGMVYLLGRQVSNRLESLFSAALLAFSYHHVWFSQNARGYTGLLFWTHLASWLFLKGLRETRSRLWLLYAATAAFGVYTHLTMVFVIVGHFTIYLITLVTKRKEVWPNRWTGFFLGFCVAALLTLLLHSPVITQMLSTIGGTEESVVSEWKNPLWTILEVIKGLQIGFLTGVVVLVALLFFGAGLVSYLRTDATVIQLLVIPPIVGSAVVMGIGHHLWPRFFFFTIGFGALVLIRGVMILGQRIAELMRIPSERSTWAGTALSVGLIFVSAVSMTFAYGPKQDYDGARAFVESERAPEDTVVVVDIAAYVYEHFYELPWENIESLDALDAIRARSRRVWLIYTFPPVLRAVHPDIMTSIETDFRLVKAFPGTVAGGTVFVCTSNKHP